MNKKRFLLLIFLSTFCISLTLSTVAYAYDNEIISAKFGTSGYVDLVIRMLVVISVCTGAVTTAIVAAFLHVLKPARQEEPTK